MAGADEPPVADADLRNADPEEEDELYDDALRLWRHFWSDRPRKVSIGKISKVLHLKYRRSSRSSHSRLQGLLKQGEACCSG
jgi:hypothetical protein